MNKLEIKLKQHTPIIHFQHWETGATLRASELKPKLDKYLIKYAFKEDFDQFKEYLIGWQADKTEKDFNGKFSFDYKIKIFNNKNNRTIDLGYPIFHDVQNFL